MLHIGILGAGFIVFSACIARWVDSKTFSASWVDVASNFSAALNFLFSVVAPETPLLAKALCAIGLVISLKWCIDGIIGRHISETNEILLGTCAVIINCVAQLLFRRTFLLILYRVYVERNLS